MYLKKLKKRLVSWAAATRCHRAKAQCSYRNALMPFVFADFRYGQR